jgi:hypothetical protein
MDRDTVHAEAPSASTVAIQRSVANGSWHLVPDPHDIFGSIRSQLAPARRLTRRGPPR